MKSRSKKVGFSVNLSIAFVVFSLFLLVYSILMLTQTPQWFFFWSTKEQVDFSNIDGEYDLESTYAYFENNKISIPPLLPEKNIALNVLGESTGQKRIEVDLTNQRIYAFEGDNKVYDFAISSGKSWTPTPNGTFSPWIKLRYTRMKGPGYDLPNVPHTIFFYNEKVPKWKGYGIHGAYWHSNFGHPMSHGCVNVGLPDMEVLYNWAGPKTNGKSVINVTADNPGTTIIIYGATPSS